MKKQYYSIDNLMKVDSTYKLLIGQRANGKSYQVKLTCLKHAFKNHRKFVYLRRWEKDIKQDYVTDYFGDMPVLDITEGKYCGVMAYHGYIYFYNLDDDGNPVKGEKIGRYLALNLGERYKSQVFDGYDYCIFEEFITDGQYLGDDEPRRLQQIISSIFRHNKGVVFMVGNTLSRTVPYFSEWSLTSVLRMKPGTIEVYHFNVDDNVINVAVEYCANVNYKNSMFFGQASKQIVSGEWDVYDMPKLPGEQKDYENVYKMLVEYKDFRFCMNLLVDYNGGKIVFIHPQTTRTKFDRILTDRFSVNPLISARLMPDRKPEAAIQDCFRQNKVCYSDNLTGTDFKHVNEHFCISPLF